MFWDADGDIFFNVDSEDKNIGLDDIKSFDDANIISSDSRKNDVGCASRSAWVYLTPNLHPSMDEVTIASKFEHLLGIGRNVHCFDEMYSLYCEFVRLKGFSVITGRQRYSGNSKAIKWKEYISQVFVNWILYLGNYDYQSIRSSSCEPDVKLG